ncbi:hypothetical protein CR513_43023, partial [Mucuna pruriens]
MRLVEEIGVQVLVTKSDSQLVTGQDMAKMLVTTFKSFTPLHDLIATFFRTGGVPNDPLEAKKLRRKAAKYTLISQKLYKRGFSYPLLKYLDHDEVEYAMKEIHERVCGTHIGSQALVNKIARAGCYWSTLKKNCTKFIKWCDKCQRFADMHKTPPRASPSNNSTLAFSHLGSRYFGTFPFSNQTREISHMDRSGVDSNNLDQESETILLKKDNMLFQTPKCHSDLEEDLRKLKTDDNRNYPKCYGHTTLPPIPPPKKLSLAIPVEIGELSLRIHFFQPAQNKEEIRITHVKEVATKARAAWQYNSKVFPRKLKKGDLVLKRHQQQANTQLGEPLQNRERSKQRSFFPGAPRWKEAPTHHRVYVCITVKSKTLM